MDAILHLTLPDDLKSVIDRQIADGRAASEAAFMREAALRYAEHLDAEDELLAIAKAGIADAEAGRYTLIETSADAAALFQETMARVRANLGADQA